MANEPGKPDFSNVQSGTSSPADAAKPDFGNVQSGTVSSAPAGAQTYTVVAGDNLTKIARTFYGDPNRWHEIYEANRDQIKNPDLIRVGQVLKLPAAVRNKS